MGNIISQLKLGIKVESEHQSTADWIKSQCKKDKCPTNKDIFKRISKDHLKEDNKYYSKLKKARL